jgi:hypothetical protein
MASARLALHMQLQSAAAIDLLDVVVSVHGSFRRPKATLSVHGSGSLQAEAAMAACQTASQREPRRLNGALTESV